MPLPDEYSCGRDKPYVCVVLTERQWDVVRDACYRRGTKQAADMAQRIFEQGGTSFIYVMSDVDPMGEHHAAS